MPSGLTTKLVRLQGIIFVLSIVAWAQCPVNTLIVKGHVDHFVANSDYRVRVQLVYPKHKPGESGEAIMEDATFQIPVEFVTAKSSIFTNPAQKMQPKTADCSHYPTAWRPEVGRSFPGFHEELQSVGPQRLYLALGIGAQCWFAVSVKIHASLTDFELTRNFR